MWHLYGDPFAGTHSSPSFATAYIAAPAVQCSCSDERLSYLNAVGCVAIITP